GERVGQPEGGDQQHDQREDVDADEPGHREGQQARDPYAALHVDPVVRWFRGGGRLPRPGSFSGDARGQPLTVIQASVHCWKLVHVTSVRPSMHCAMGVVQNQTFLKYSSSVALKYSQCALASSLVSQKAAFAGA